LKILRGNPGKRPLNKREPRPQPIAPKCPAWLDPEAKREWRRIVPPLDKIGMLTQADMATVAGYCQSYSRWMQAERVLSEHGLTMEYETKTGALYSQARPEVAISQKERQLMMQFGARLGLSPSDRGRMTLPQVDSDDDTGLD